MGVGEGVRTRCLRSVAARQFLEFVGTSLVVARTEQLQEEFGDEGGEALVVARADQGRIEG